MCIVCSLLNEDKLESISNALLAILEACYALSGNWWLAIFIFTFATKIILMPLSLWCQKNSIKLVSLMPSLNKIKVQFFGDKEAIGEKQGVLYKEQHYHPLLSLVPLVIQILILILLINVIRSLALSGAEGTDIIALIPVSDGGFTWLAPIFAGLSAVLLGVAQNHINPLQKEQSRLEQLSTNGLSVFISLLLGTFVACGLAFYWVCSNILSITVQLLCNLIIKPQKYVDYDELHASKLELEKLQQLDKEAGNKRSKADIKRERADYKRFFKISNKHLVFFSEASGFYKYFRGMIDYLLENSNICIHYITQDPHDQIFQIAVQKPRIFPYYIGKQRIITLMMKMDADVVVTTLPQLDEYHIKRSYVRKDIKYIFTFHHMTSANLVSPEKSFDHYDAVLCAGPHQKAEIMRMEEVYELPHKELVEAGYPLLDEDIARYCQLKHKFHKENNNSTLHQSCISIEQSPVEQKVEQNGAVQGNKKSIAEQKPYILIAPSWQEDSLLDICIEPMVQSLTGRGWDIVVRPHPEYLKRKPAQWKTLCIKLKEIAGEEVIFEEDFSSDSSVFMADVLITDWSSISCEYSFVTKRPTVFVDTPMKVHNPRYKDLEIEPADIYIRNKIGISIVPEHVASLGDEIQKVLLDKVQWESKISDVLQGFVYNLGTSAQVQGEYVLNCVLEQQEKRTCEQK